MLTQEHSHKHRPNAYESAQVASGACAPSCLQAVVVTAKLVEASDLTLGNDIYLQTLQVCSKSLF